MHHDALLTSQNSISSSGTPVRQKSEARYSTMSTRLSSWPSRAATSRVRDRHESHVSSFLKMGQTEL